MKRLLLTALLALSLHAETVYVTAHGKTFHSNRQCMSLAKSNRVLTTDDKTALAHGLHECGICAHRHSGKPHADGNTWATPEVKR
jgi:hypothetical protein